MPIKILDGISFHFLFTGVSDDNYPSAAFKEIVLSIPSSENIYEVFYKDSTYFCICESGNVYKGLDEPGSVASLCPITVGPGGFVTSSNKTNVVLEDNVFYYGLKQAAYGPNSGMSVQIFSTIDFETEETFATGLGLIVGYPNDRDPVILCVKTDITGTLFGCIRIQFDYAKNIVCAGVRKDNPTVPVPQYTLSLADYTFADNQKHLLNTYAAHYLDFPNPANIDIYFGTPLFCARVFLTVNSSGNFFDVQLNNGYPTDKIFSYIDDKTKQLWQDIYLQIGSQYGGEVDEFLNTILAGKKITSSLIKYVSVKNVVIYVAVEGGILYEIDLTDKKYSEMQFLGTDPRINYSGVVNNLYVFAGNSGKIAHL